VGHRRPDEQPARALENLLARDHLFTTRVAAEAERLGLQVLDVDIGATPDDLVTGVAALLHL
jgi:hypothetical protein